jgi:dihydrodipicolinate synthase/N-acetylneuraminate lyase
MPETKVPTATRLVRTNLASVFSKVQERGSSAAASGIAPLLDPSLLARLQGNPAPGARAFLEKVLSRQWRPEDQITPMLKPLRGVTHQLTPRTEAENASFTSTRWAGGTIRGPVTAAFGIWRVPTVSRSPEPPGTAGDWNSSSWVGIDGTYGSNDVLQAGVQQEVSADGHASYTPWYEWYAPQVAGSPDYIFQTNIENMEIQPGDEVFCAIYYVTQQTGAQGEVLFGNTTRGHYFSIVLAPPPGASFSGNSAEWIMEAPNGGEPGNSLPRFSPVVFSTAFASAASGGSGDPANGDATNITGFGSILTSVTLKSMALEIDYTPTWAHNLPGSAAGAVPIRAGTSPTSWYTTPEDVQHVAYVGVDGLIHELFYVIGGDGVWRHNLPSAAAGSVPVRPGTSPTSWYTTPENVQHIAYVGVDGVIHELFYVIGGDGVWRHNLPSLASGSVPVAQGTNPTSWYTTPENVQHIAYVGVDGRIHELFYVIGGDGAWHHNLPSAAAGSVAVRAATSPTSWYTTPENVQHIAYVGVDGLIHELFYFIGGDGVWRHNLPSLAAGSVPVAVGTSPTSWYTTPENVQHIAYVGVDGAIHELFYFIAGDGAWHHNLPSAAAGSVPVRAGTSPTSWYTTPEDVQHIAYVGVDGRIHELFYFIVGDAAWHHNLPSLAPGAVPVAAGTSPTSWYTTPENVQHVAYAGIDGLVHELYYFVG